MIGNRIAAAAVSDELRNFCSAISLLCGTLKARQELARDEVTGVSARMDSDELVRRDRPGLGKASRAAAPFLAGDHYPRRPSVAVNVGPHPPRLRPQDLDRALGLWLRLQNRFVSRLHYRDVVGLALRWLEKDLAGERAQEVLTDLDRELKKTDSLPERPLFL
jgi:hypothetical protein